MSTVIEVNAETGEQQQRPASSAEQADWKREADAAMAAEKAQQDASAKRAADEQAWRDALKNASTVAGIRDVLLGTNLPAQAAARPTR